ncbi:hypothetical protein FRC01_002628, partial [Tulasnella sp. 417]
MSKYRVFLGAPDVPTVLKELPGEPAVIVPTVDKWAKSQISFPRETPLPPRVESQPHASAPRNYTASLDLPRFSASTPQSESSLDPVQIGTLTPEDDGFYVLPEKTFHDASRRLSKLYAGVIFGDEEKGDESGSLLEVDGGSGAWNKTRSDMESWAEESEAGSVVLSGPRGLPGSENEDPCPSNEYESTPEGDEEDSLMEDDTNTTIEGDSI